MMTRADARAAPTTSTRALNASKRTTSTSTRATRRDVTHASTLCALASALAFKSEQNLARAAADDENAPDDDDDDDARTFSVETTSWTIARVPPYYEGPIDLGASASATTYACLLRDKRFGMAGETITLAEQTATSGGPRALRDIGTVDDVAARVVDGENAKSRGAAAAVVRETTTRTTEGVEYYGVEYEKTVLGARRVVALTLALVADETTGASTLFTLTVERRAKDFDANVDALRDVGRAFRVEPTP